MTQGGQWSVALLIALVSSLLLAILIVLVMGLSFAAATGQSPVGAVGFAFMTIPMFAVGALVAGLLAAIVAVLVTRRSEAGRASFNRLVYIASFAIAFGACTALFFSEAFAPNAVSVSIGVAAALLLGSAAGYLAQRLTFTAAR